MSGLMRCGKCDRAFKSKDDTRKYCQWCRINMKTRQLEPNKYGNDGEYDLRIKEGFDMLITCG